jgi:putative cardiolipin synthase
MNYYRKINRQYSWKGAVLFSSLLLLLSGGCASLPENVGRTASYAVSQDVSAVSAAIMIGDTQECGAECSAFSLLNRGVDALRWRLALIESARRSLDLQYYIWQDDESGRLLFSKVIEAADRGVRVRLLFDDTAMLSKEAGAALVNYHPNIEIRTFNPFSARSSIWTLIDGAFNLGRLNNRMHNKLLVVDNVLAITGGRNIGNKYFGLDKRMNFRDMDVLALGPVVKELSDVFDDFWNSRWAYPPEAFVGKFTDEDEFNRVRQRFAEDIAKDRELTRFVELSPSVWEEMKQRVKENTVIARSTVVRDSSDISSEQGRQEAFETIALIAEKAFDDVVIISPYFIPTDEGVVSLSNSVKSGKKVTVLTNSLGSNDVTATNAAYKHYRKPLVNGGIKLYELRGDAQARSFYRSSDTVPKYLGLHAKVMIFDHRDVYIGSLNLDPRSVLLNTELGLFIESPELAAQVERAFSLDLAPENSWVVGVDENNTVYWQSGEEITYWQPARNTWQRIMDWIIPGRLLEGHL